LNAAIASAFVYSFRIVCFCCVALAIASAVMASLLIEGKHPA
jgi:hypothetical protein